MRENSMTKRILSILLCLCMVMSQFPTAVLAVDVPSEVIIGGVTVDSNDWYATTDVSGNVITEGANADNWNIHVTFDNANSTTGAAITLKNATIKNTVDTVTHAISAINCDLNISLEGTSNQIGTESSTGVYGQAIFVPTENKVTVTGEGATIVNNSYITLPKGMTATQIAALPLSGSGLVRIATEYGEDGLATVWDTYTNDGVALKTVSGGIDLTDGTDHSSATLKNNGYEWDAIKKTLTLGNAYILGNIILPAGSTINNISNSIISGDINGAVYQPCNITITGSAQLMVNDINGGGTNGDTITIRDGANVTVNGQINIGASGGKDGTLNISGQDTIVNVKSNAGSAVFCDTVNIDGGASLIASSEGSAGVFAQTGVNVRGGSKLTTNCKYGVYVLGGKLEVETGSKLITNGSVAPFCVAAPFNKTQSETLSLPGIPDGTKIASVQGTYTGFGTVRTYRSIAPEGGSLSVSGEQNDCADLSGAFIGPAIFQSNLKESEITVSGTYTYNGTTQVPTVEKVTLDSGKHIVHSNNYDITASNNINAGTATVTVTAKGSSNYAGTKSTTFTINKAEQSALSINEVNGKKYGDSPFTISTIGGSGAGNVSYVSSDPTILSISGPTATIHKVGTVTITATKAADTNYNEAKTTMSLTISYGGSTGGNSNGNNSGGSSQSNSYKLIFDTNGGSKISDVTKPSGTIIDLREYKPTQAGFNFDGWYTDEALTDKVAEIKLNKNTTIYAKWIETSEKIINPFIDVAENSYYHDAVLWAIEESITSGTSANTFSPEIITTRAQMVTFLWRTVGMPQTTLANSNFNDMDKDAYYYQAVLWAEENGVTVGTSATTFSPEDKVIRGQVVSFLWRLDGRPASTSVNPFIDINNSMYYYEAILWAVEKGITYGTSESKYSPDDPCLRAHIVTFLYRKLAD